MEEFYLRAFIISIGCIITSYIILRKQKKKLGITRYDEVINIVVLKGTKEKLKGIAALKGYKNESEYIADLINKDIEIQKNLIEKN